MPLINNYSNKSLNTCTLCSICVSLVWTDFNKLCLEITLLAQIVNVVLYLTPTVFRSIVVMELSIFMAFWAHYDGFFAKVSFTTVNLLLAVMSLLSLSLMKFKYTLNLVASAAIESRMICSPPCNRPLPLNLIFNLSILSCNTSFSF
jgi:hypothetical protein